MQMLYSFEQFVRYRWKGIAQRTCMRYVASMCSCWLAVIRVNGGLTSKFYWIR